MMLIQFVGPDDIRPHLNIERLIEPMKQAFIAFSQGKADTPIYVLHPTAQSDIHVKSATIEGSPFFTVKMAGWSQVLSQKGEHPSSGIIAIFNSQTCQPVAILQDDHLISDFRTTAAAGALASQYLSRPDSETVTIVRTGTQARLQALAVAHVRSIKKLMVWGRTSAKAESLAHQLAEQLPDVSVTAYQNLEAAVRCADIVIVATMAREPIECIPVMR